MSKDSTETTSKLRRKEVAYQSEKKKAETNITADSVYKQTVDQEEAEAVSRDGIKDENLYVEFCESLRNYILELGTEADMSSSRSFEIKKEISMIFVILKKLNRLEKYRLKNARETLQTKKLKVDSYNLQLQNLRYEIYHLKKEVVKCLQFRSKDEDIDLVDEETFFQEAPESISRPEITKEDAHQLKLARLEWELKQRKEQSDLCQKVEAENENVAADINKKRSQLDNLAPMLKQILAAAKPLQDNLGSPECSSRPQYSLAPLLPEPLYCLFVQTDAYRQACSPSIVVKISGSEEEAEKTNKMLNDIATAESDSDTEELVEKSSSKHRHSKSRLSEVEKNIVDKAEDKRQKLCLSHPLSVDITFKLKDSLPSLSDTPKSEDSAPPTSMTCSFHYLYNLHVVTVKVIRSALVKDNFEMLAGLFPEDFIREGETPNIANHYQLKQHGLTFDTSKLGYPYVWVQRMAGLDFMTSNPSSSNINDGKVTAAVSLSQACVPVIIKKLKLRFKSSIELSTLLVQLEKGQLLGPHQCNLSLWQNISWSQYESQDLTRHHIQAGHVSSNVLYYKTLFTRGLAKLEAYISVGYDYPIIPPLFAVQIDLNREIKSSANDDGVRDIEKELNVHWRELGDSFGAASTLLSQIECLSSCFDIYLECLDVKEFPRKMTFIKSARGRTRAHPYKFTSTKGNLHSQR